MKSWSKTITFLAWTISRRAEVKEGKVSEGAGWVIELRGYTIWDSPQFGCRP